MRSLTSCTRLLAVSLFCAGRLIAADAVAVKDLPSAVLGALGKNFAGAQIVKAERDASRNDCIYYTVTLRTGKHEQEITLNEFGEISPLR